MSGAGMVDEKIRAVLEQVALIMHEEGFEFAQQNPLASEQDYLLFAVKVLEERLGPLLLAGQAMRDMEANNRWERQIAWDSALAAAQGQPEKESGQ